MKLLSALQSQVTTRATSSGLPGPPHRDAAAEVGQLLGRLREAGRHDRGHGEAGADRVGGDRAHVPPEHEAEVKEAVLNCPERAITTTG